MLFSCVHFSESVWTPESFNAEGTEFKTEIAESESSLRDLRVISALSALSLHFFPLVAAQPR